jgi:hypothetical protein
VTPRAFPLQIPARCHCQTCRQTPWTDPEGDRTGGVRGIAVCGRPGVRGWVGRLN